MTDHPLRPRIDTLWEGREMLSPATTGDDRNVVDEVLGLLDSGTLRVAEPGAVGWVVHEWLI